MNLWIGVNVERFAIGGRGHAGQFMLKRRQPRFETEPAFEFGSVWVKVTARATVWTTDLTYEYVRINADYRMNKSMHYQIETAALNAWPGLQTYVYDGWLLRLRMVTPNARQFGHAFVFWRIRPGCKNCLL